LLDPIGLDACLVRQDVDGCPVRDAEAKRRLRDGRNDLTGCSEVRLKLGRGGGVWCENGRAKERQMHEGLDGVEVVEGVIRVHDQHRAIEFRRLQRNLVGRGETLDGNGVAVRGAFAHRNSGGVVA